MLIGIFFLSRAVHLATVIWITAECDSTRLAVRRRGLLHSAVASFQLLACPSIRRKWRSRLTFQIPLDLLAERGLILLNNRGELDFAWDRGGGQTVGTWGGRDGRLERIRAWRRFMCIGILYSVFTYKRSRWCNMTWWLSRLREILRYSLRLWAKVRVSVSWLVLHLIKRVVK